MARNRMSWTLGAALCLALAAPAFAREAGPRVVVKVSVLKETVVRNAAGAEERKLEPVTQTRPGDTLLYRILATNEGDAPARDARIVDPIPAGTRLVPVSWSPAGPEFSVSIDGGKSFESFPIRRPVKLASGEVVQKEVDPASYTHVRWSALQPLPPGESREAAFKVIVR